MSGFIRLHKKIKLLKNIAVFFLFSGIEKKPFLIFLKEVFSLRSRIGLANGLDRLFSDENSTRALYKYWYKQSSVLNVDFSAGGRCLYKVIIICEESSSQKDLESSLASVRSQVDSENILFLGDFNKFTDCSIIALSNISDCSMSDIGRICHFLNGSNSVIILEAGSLLADSACALLHQSASAFKHDLIYSDHDYYQDGQDIFHRCYPFFKPDFSPDLLHLLHYLSALMLVRTGFLIAYLEEKPAFCGEGIYSLGLDLINYQASVGHISSILCHLPLAGADISESEHRRIYAKFLNIDMSRLGPIHIDRFDAFAVDYSGYAEDVKCSIIIPTKDGLEYLTRCVDSILEITDYDNYEIIIIDNASEKAETIHYLACLASKEASVLVVPANIPFNWSRLNNIGVASSSGDVLLFLNNDTEVLHPEWLRRLCGQARRTEVGCVGPLLLYPDGAIQYAGMVIGYGAAGLGDHVFNALQPEDNNHMYVSPLLQRNVSACTGACLVVEKSLYEALDGFDERFEVCGGDLDISVRAIALGYNNIYDPSVTLIHHESKSRGKASISSLEQALITESIGSHLGCLSDPYYNVNLSLASKRPVVDIGRSVMGKIRQ